MKNWFQWDIPVNAFKKPLSNGLGRSRIHQEAGTVDHKVNEATTINLYNIASRAPMCMEQAFWPLWFANVIL